MRTAPLLTIKPDPVNELGLVIEYHEPSLSEPLASETIDLGPNPTWPSPAEQSDQVADAVRRVWDSAWKYYTGEEVERNA